MIATLLIAAIRRTGALRKDMGQIAEIAIRPEHDFYTVFLATLVLTGGSLLRDQFSGSGPRHFLVSGAVSASIAAIGEHGWPLARAVGSSARRAADACGAGFGRNVWNLFV